MFLQNLKKRISKIVNVVEDSLEFYFKEILLGLLLIGAIILVIVIFISIFAVKCSHDSAIKKLPLKAIDGSKAIEFRRRSKLDMLLQDSFLYPKAEDNELIEQYIDFFPTKKLKQISFLPILKEYDKLFRASLQESLLFDFEKKKRGK